MNFGSVLNVVKGIGLGLVKEVPGGDLLLSVVNELLPEDKKLSDKATGVQVSKAFSSLSPEQQSSILSKKIDLQIKQEEGWTHRHTTMAKNDGQSTRPKIALIYAYVTAFCLVGFVFILFYITNKYGVAGLKEAADLWPLFGTVLAIPSTVIRLYFGDLVKEQHARSSHKPENPFSSIIKSLKG